MRKTIKLDREEKELVSSFERDEWKSVKNVEKQKKHARQIRSPQSRLRFFSSLKNEKKSSFE